MAKVTKEKFKTYKNVFDNYTLRNLFRLSSQGYFENITSPISIGKEANIFSATTKGENPVILKIYRLETCDFNRMYDYIKYDPRYQHLKNNRRKIIFAWANREFRNLLISREVGVRSPTPIAIRDNIIVMEMIGKNWVPSPKLKDCPPQEPEKFITKTIGFMKKLYVKGGLVHGDLSEFNILNSSGSPVFIDFSQATPVKNQSAKELLERDVKNIVRYSKKLGLSLDEKAVFKDITGGQ